MQLRFQHSTMRRKPPHFASGARRRVSGASNLVRLPRRRKQIQVFSAWLPGAIPPFDDVRALAGAGGGLLRFLDMDIVGPLISFR